ncbi:sensor histidine kinase [Streptomyces boninensis]|uniref:sensor histidine kinase n=1 Tax=Streptomyces boninensis TaxID=2039455 RepID=UPI003B21AC3B
MTPDHHADPADTLGRPDPDTSWLAAVIHVAFFLLLGGALARFLIRHPGELRTPWIIALSATLALLYALGPALGGGPTRATARRLLWLALVVGVWVVLVLLAPSFAWCAVPLFYTGLRTLPMRGALVLVGLLTAFVVGAQMQLAKSFDPNLLLAPPAVAALATAVFVHMERQAERQRTLIHDLIRTRRELAATERREGTLAERQRLSMEIHDTLAQSLSSQRMLLQAADRMWDTDPAKARAHIRTAGAFTERGLSEARRFVHDLAPAGLAEAEAAGGGLSEALRALVERESAAGATAVRFHAEVPAEVPGGVPGDVPAAGSGAGLPAGVQAALLRITQGALANVREHAGARNAAVTLTHLDDQVVVDIADDGRGFAPESAGPPGPQRGHGLPAIRARARQLGGTVTVESAPGQGTVLSVSIPLTAPSPEVPPSAHQQPEHP